MDKIFNIPFPHPDLHAKRGEREVSDEGEPIHHRDINGR